MGYRKHQAVHIRNVFGEVREILQKLIWDGVLHSNVWKTAEKQPNLSIQKRRFLHVAVPRASRQDGIKRLMDLPRHLGVHIRNPLGEVWEFLQKPTFLTSRCAKLKIGLQKRVS